MSVRFSIALVVASAVSACGGAVPDSSSSSSSSAGVIALDTGPVHGTQENGVWAYLGIPYAAPPVGALRWEAPQPPVRWETPLDASAFGAACVQVLPNVPVPVGQEDCLTANVWAPPSATPASPRPVLVFIHGGGNVEGWTGQRGEGTGRGALGFGENSPQYDGAALAAKENVMVVTFNYRLGPFGFLALPAFGANAGNYGLRDQIFALGWAKRNAAAFGGDATRVLLFGHSSGAADACDLVASPMANGLFSAVIVESGVCIAAPATVAHSFAQSWAQKAGCGSASDVAACLRTLDPYAVALVQPETPDIGSGARIDYQPSVDGAVLPDAPLQIIRTGRHNHVPLVFGSNSDETALSVARAHPQGMTVEEYASNLPALVGDDPTLASELLALYPASDYATPLEAYIQATTDRIQTSGATLGACMAATGQTDAPVWRYFFTHHLDNGTALEKMMGAWHGEELAFVFRHLRASDYTPSEGEQTLTDAIENDWASIAASGVPVSSPAWPRYVPSTDPYVQLDDTVTTGAGLRTKKVQFWNRVTGRPPCP